MKKELLTIEFRYQDKHISEEAKDGYYEAFEQHKLH